MNRSDPLHRRVGTVLICALILLVPVMATVPDAPARSAQPPPASLDTDAVDAFVNDYLDRHGLVGSGVAVVQDGRVVHTAGYGETADGAPVGPDTPMAIGSVSKPITAFAVLQLVAEGKVALDDPILSHLPALEIGDDRASEITVRHLLSHTSGLPDPVIVPPADSLAEDVSHLDDWTLDSEPGTTYSYSNYNYRIAARLVEVVTATPFAEYLHREVFAPLGMTDTRSVTTRDDPVLATGHVTAYGLALPVGEMEQMSAGSGGVISTPEDMAKWLAMQTNGGRTADGEQLLPADLLAESHTPQPGAERAGLGWSNSRPGIDPARVSHSGSLTRFNAQMDLVPSSGYGVVVMLNSFTPTREHAYELSSAVIEITEGGDPAPGPPVATFIDGAVGLITLLVLALTMRGLRRSGRWSARRSAWPAWRYALRLLPSMVFPVLATYIFLVLPQLQDNSATTLDAFFLWPAGMVLLLALAASGLALLVVRTRHRLTGSSPEMPRRRRLPTTDVVP